MYRTSPVYPISKRQQGKGGTVIVELNVDENGFVQNPHVVESKGGKAFQKSALTAAKKFRYIPKFVEGEPVTAEGVRYKFTFKIDG